jgi:hypothetical protein
LYDKGGELALKENSRWKPIPKNRVAPEIENAVIEMAIEPGWQPTCSTTVCFLSLNKRVFRCCRS